MTATSALILAAGISSRMGSTKQLLDLGGVPMLERVIEKVTTFAFSEIIIVIGHEAEQVKNNVAIKDERCRWVVNPDYADGQSFSLKAGVAAIQTPNVMVFLGDQPFITNTTISNVYEKGESLGEKLSRAFAVRPIYRSIPGHPVFFGNIRQIDFSTLSSDRGAQSLIKQLDNYYELPAADDGSIFDIDTPARYEQAKLRWSLTKFRDCSEG